MSREQPARLGQAYQIAKRGCAKASSSVARVWKTPACQFCVRHSLEIVAGAAGVAAFAVLALVWQLSSGSVSLDLLTPNIADAVNRSLGGSTVRFGASSVTRADNFGGFDMHVENVELFSADGQIIATIPELDLNFTAAALLSGSPVPQSISVTGASATIVRRGDGTFRFLINDETSPSPRGGAGRGRAFAGLIASLATPQDNRAGFLTRLKEFNIVDGSVVLIDRSSAGVWRAENAQINIASSDAGIDAVMDAELRLPQGVAPIHVNGAIDRALELATVAFAVDPVSPAQLSAGSSPTLDRIRFPVEASGALLMRTDGALVSADISVTGAAGTIDLRGIDLYRPDTSPALEQPWPDDPEKSAPAAPPPPLGVIDVESFALSGTLNAESGRFAIDQLALWSPQLNVDFTGGVAFAQSPEDLTQLDWLAADLSATEAEVALVGFFEDVVPVEELSIAASWERDTNVINLDTLTLAAFGGTVAVSGAVSPVEREGVSPAVALTGSVANMPVAGIKGLWPVFAVLGARDWIAQNVFEGTITKGALIVDIAPGQLNERPLPDEAVNFAFDFEGGRANFIRGLTPLSEISGSAVLQGNSFTLRVPRAKIGGLTATDGRIDMPRLNPKGDLATYQATVEGEASEILALIDMPPLELTRKFGLDPARVAGTTVMDLTIVRPMRRYVPIDYIDYTFKAKGRGLGLDNVLAGLPLTDGTMTIDVDKMGIVGKGTVSLAGLPAVLEWTERFNSGDAPSTAYRLRIDVDVAELESLGVNPGDAVKGPISLEIATVGNGIEFDSAELAVDFTGTAVDLPALTWAKPAGKIGAGSVSLDWDSNGALSLSDIEIKGEGIAVTGDVQLASDFKLLRADLPSVALGQNTDFALSASRGENNALSLSITGRALDIGPFLQDSLTSAGLGGGGNSAPIELNVALQSLHLANGVILNDVALDYGMNGQVITALDLEAGQIGGGEVAVRLTGAPESVRAIEIDAADTGNLLSGLAGITNIAGGRLKVQADLVPPGSEIDGADSSPRITEAGMMTGTLSVEEFRVLKLPLMAKVLSAASLTGLADMLNGEGLAFDRLEVPFMSEGPVLQANDAIASGSSLGVTLDGFYDGDAERIDVVGTLVPAYAINSAFGAVPLLGDLMVSKEGQGFVALTYKIEGAMDEARVVVNPLSALAPGFLRRLFEFSKPQNRLPPPATAQTRTPQPTEGGEGTETAAENREQDDASEAD